MPKKRGKTPTDPATLAIQERIGARIRSARIEAGLSQEAAAHAAGIDAKRYQRVELGRVNMTINTIARIATALGTTFWELVRNSGR